MVTITYRRPDAPTDDDGEEAEAEAFEEFWSQALEDAKGEIGDEWEQLELLSHNLVVVGKFWYVSFAFHRRQAESR
jgi:hypothetical protein